MVYSGRALDLGTGSFTLTGGYILYYDFADNQFHVEETIKTFTGMKVNNIFVLANEPQLQDIVIFNQDPNLVGKLAINGSLNLTGITLTLSPTDEYYSCMENSGDKLIGTRNATEVTITDYTPSIRTKYETHGIQTSAFERDVDGLPIRYEPGYMIFDDAYADTQWAPDSIGDWTIFETLNDTDYIHVCIRW